MTSQHAGLLARNQGLCRLEAVVSRDALTSTAFDSFVNWTKQNTRR